MSYSELKNIEHGKLDFSESDCALYGALYGCPLCISDNPAEHTFTVTFFARVPLAFEKEAAGEINRLAGLLPKNAVLKQKIELNHLQVTLSSFKLVQENLPLLIDFAEGLGSFLQEKGCAATELDKKFRALYVPKKTAVKKSKKAKEPSMSFDRRSICGLIGAIIGAIACIIISGFAVQLTISAEAAEPAVTTSAAEEIIPAVKIENTNNIGAELVSWVVGALTAAVILIDYRFLAKKTDIFGMVSCTVLTLGGVLGGTLLCGVRTLHSVCREAGVDSNFFMIMSNIDYYNGLFPEVGANLNYLLLKSLFSAAVASGVYYVWYFRKNADVMYLKKSD